MDALSVVVGGILGGLIIFVLTQNKKIKELENKVMPDKEACVQDVEDKKRVDYLLYVKVWGLKLLLVLLNAFKWTGRCRRRVFWVRWLVIWSVVSTINGKIQDYALEQVILGNFQIVNYNAYVYICMMIWLVMLGPSVAQRLHDVGRSCVHLFIWWFWCIPLVMSLDWGQYETTLKAWYTVAFLLFCVYWVPVCFFKDSAENNEWGVSPKYPDGKEFDGSKFLLK